MMNIFAIVFLVILGILLVLIVLYVFLINRLRRMQTKIFSYKEEVELKEKNVLIIYQPSKHKTIQKIVELVKEEVAKKNYGYKVHTLSKKKEEYKDYKYVIIVAPVYLGDIHREWLNVITDKNINKLVVIYNGLNDKSNAEDEIVSKTVKKYAKIKLHTTDIENVRPFLEKEVL